MLRKQLQKYWAGKMWDSASHIFEEKDSKQQLR